MSGVEVNRAVGFPHASEVELPAPTAWPFALAFGCTLLFAGLLTNVSLSLLGAVLAIAGCVGWFRELFPHQQEETVPVVAEEVVFKTDRHEIERLPIAPELVRAWLPVQVQPISAGLKGGVAGGFAMALVACTYGFLKVGSIWYPINLLAATIYSMRLGPTELKSFHGDSFLMALLLHAIGSVFVGLLYGAMIPMLARRPILLGGLIAPVLWSGLLYTTIGLFNPLLESRIDWKWFMASQFAFGIVTGMIATRQSRHTTRENIPFLIRAGVEAPGIMRPRERRDQ
jgi:hypothetical protein